MAANHVDHGWAWVVLFATCLMSACSDGFRNCSGMFYSEFIDTMNLSRPQAASVVALLNAMFLLPGPISALLAQKIGSRLTIILGALVTAGGLLASAFVRTHWALVMTFGALTGFGFCLSFLPAMGSLPVWFTKYRQLAPAVAMTSGAIGIFLYAPLTQVLIETYTWRGAAIVLAAVCLNSGVLCGVVSFPVKAGGPSRPTADRQSDTRALFTNPAYLIHLLNGFFMFGIMLFLIFIVRHVTSHRGYTHQEGAFLVSICGVTSLLGRMMFIGTNFIPALATKSVRFYLFNFSSLFGGLACGLVPMFWNFYAVAVVCGVMGFMQGLKISTMLNVTMDITTPARFQTGYGYFCFASGISVLAVPPFAGYLAETFLNYDPVFYLSAAALALTFVLGSMSQFLENRKS